MVVFLSVINISVWPQPDLLTNSIAQFNIYLVHLGCYYKVLYWVANKNKNLFFTVLEVGKSRIKVPADSLSVECHFLYKLSFLCLLRWWKRGGNSVGFALMTITSQSPNFQTPWHLENRFQHRNFGEGYTNIQSITSMFH